MKNLSARALRADLFTIGDDFYGYLEKTLRTGLSHPQEELEGKVLAVTSKIVSLAENRFVAKDEVEKVALIKSEADQFLGEMGYGCYLTIKEGLLIPSSGIDESNAEKEMFILFPQDPFVSAEKIRNYVAKKFGLRKFGVILTDSHTAPLRVGVTGLALSHYGFKGVQNKIGEKDLFGRVLKMTQINIADAVATAAVFCMGEAAEQCPMALVQTEVEFEEGNLELRRTECKVTPELDLYYPLYKQFLKD